jgi:hypothetical protein
LGKDGGIVLMSNFQTQHITPITVNPADQETTNAYADVDGSLIDTYGKSIISYTCKNTDGANSIDWKVLASNDGTTYIEAQAEASLAAAAVGTFTSIAYYRYYKVQVKATVADSQGDAQIEGISKAG